MNERLNLLYGIDENAEQFNQRVNENWQVLKHFIDENFDENNLLSRVIASRKVYNADGITSKEKSEALKKAKNATRQVIISDAKEILGDVCKQNDDQFNNLKNAYEDQKSYEFEKFINYNIPEERRFIEGEYGVTAITLRMVGNGEETSENDQMFIKFKAPNELILDSDTKAEEILEWFDSINEIFVEYDEALDVGYDVKTWSISEQGSMLLTPEDGVMDIDDIEAFTITAKRYSRDEQELRDLEYVYKKFGSMKIASFGSTQISLND